MYFLAIDPGNHTGVALFEKGSLIDCALVTPQWRPETGVLLSGIMLEHPTIRRARHAKGDPNDLSGLIRQIGNFEEWGRARGVAVRWVAPRDWKGTIDKSIMCRRIVSELSPTERALYDARIAKVANGLRNNVEDAIGLGKWAYSKRIWK